MYGEFGRTIILFFWSKYDFFMLDAIFKTINVRKIANNMLDSSIYLTIQKINKFYLFFDSQKKAFPYDLLGISNY